MASRILHLAVADALLKEFDIDGPARFFLGSVLPDAKIDSRLRALPHYQTILPNGLITYKLKEFLSVYGSKMMDDSLYLGYYLHLIQDIFYRRYMYALPNWDARIWENVMKLHSDYRKINRYIIETRGLENGISLPSDFSEEDINLRFEFDAEGFLRELEGDFTNISRGEYYFFTPEMADEYLDIAIEQCRKELRAIREGLPLLDEIQMAWGKE